MSGGDTRWPQLALDFRWNERADFGSLVPGGNPEAVDAASRVSECTGLPLFFHGPAGTGKSHLLQAMCGRATDARRTAFYLPLASMRRYPPAVLDGLERVSLIAIDDLTTVAGDPAWEEALFHLYNRLREAGAQLAVAARRPPDDLGVRLEDLVSRLQWGVIYRLEPLSDEDQARALRLRVEQRGLALPDESVRYLLSRFPRDTIGLFNLLDRLDEASLRAGRRLTIPFIREALGRVNN